MSDPLYYQDAYAREFSARVVSCQGSGVVLDQTAFYPGGGGQPCDTGNLRWGGTQVPVRSVKRDGGTVVHMVDEVEGLLPSSVEGVLDWNRRYALMRTHTALHILCGVIWQMHRALSTGCGMHPGSAHIDFELEGVTPDLLKELESGVNRQVEAARDVKTYSLDRAEAETVPDLIKTKVNLLPPELKRIRVVDIVGLDAQADGGTHVSNTKEVGPVRIVKYKSKGRQNKRLYIELEGLEEAQP
ncbi:MAG: alanyl-tRNA editing protein [Gemmatimonadetes bacterium]|nr:alanyl-tRNA editing protein [Gemmatimonadota bacterium]